MAYKKWNVLLITLDSLRADHIHTLGYKRLTTPNLDKFASRCVLFTNAITNAPSTGPAFPAILASTYPIFYLDIYGDCLPEKHIIISEILKDEGYITAAFCSNPWLHAKSRYAKGFDYYEDYLTSWFDEIIHKLRKKRQDDVKVSKRSSGKRISKINKLIKFSKNQLDTLYGQTIHRLKIIYNKNYRSAELLTKDVIRWLENLVSNNITKNFFLWLHYMDTHAPHYPASKYLRRLGCKPFSKFYMSKINDCRRTTRNDLSQDLVDAMIDLYDANILYTDDWLNYLFNNLQKLGIYNNTLIIVTSDHGEQFWERGSFGHGGTFYDEEIRVPLIIKLPQELDNGRKRINEPVSLIDIPPTILDYLDIPKPQCYQGESLKPIIEGTHKKREYAIAGVMYPINSIRVRFCLTCRTSGWKYIVIQRKNEPAPNYYLYNLQKDPFETLNLYGREKEKLNFFETKLAEHIQNEMRKLSMRVNRESRKIRVVVKELIRKKRI
jgi:arylsulfatase A-like enzyme